MSEKSELDAIREKKMREYLERANAQKKVINMEVKVYSTPTCPYCTMAKRYLDSKGVKYSDINVATDIKAAREMISKTGQMGVPQIEINGRMIIGFDRQAIDEALAESK